MFKSFSNIFTKYFLIILFFTIIICMFFIPLLSPEMLNQANNFSNSNYKENQIIISNGLYWPLPGYTKISSYFGNRNIPTAGATSFHGGIDIPAPSGTNIISVISGTVIKTGFIGSGGFSIIIQNDNYIITFHHISPNYLVSVGDYVLQGQIIAQVGPKNVYGVPNNPYKDSNR